LAVVPEEAAVFIHDPENHQKRLTLNNLIFGPLGILVVVSLGLVAFVLLDRVRHRWTTDPRFRSTDRDVCFLVLWLGLEIVGYFALTPFPAVRRVLGVVVVGTLLVGRLASRAVRVSERRRLVGAVVGLNVLLGLLFLGVDLHEASGEKAAAEGAAAWIEQQGPPEGAVWYVGHWGFQYYAERAAMKPVVPNRSRLHAGDWLVVPDDRLEQQHITVDETRTELAHQLEVVDGWPLRTVICYYGGSTPLEHHDGPRVRVQIYRIRGDWIPLHKAN
jgi:hypothetical protein